MPTVRIIGPGRAGRALAIALVSKGWDLEDFVSRGEDVTYAAIGPDLLVIATPDNVIGEVAAQIQPAPGTVVAHMAGSLGLDVLGDHSHKAAFHPLVTIPNSQLGAKRLQGAWFATASNTPGAERLIGSIIASFDGHPVPVADEHRTAYHAAAAILSNHLVGLLAHGERVAKTAGVPLEAYLGLIRMTIDNVAQLGPKAALTGPASRGDTATINRHLDALSDQEAEIYQAMLSATMLLVEGQSGVTRGAEGTNQGD